MGRNRDWDTDLELLRQYAPLCKSFTQCCQAASIPKSSVFDELKRRGMTRDDLGPYGTVPREPFSIKTETHTNTRTVETSSTRIKTLEEMLKECKIDLSVWEVDHYLINKWEMGAKERDINLEYFDGKATGYVKKGNLKLEPLWQIKIWLKRIVPIVLFPVIQPVHYEKSWKVTAAAMAPGDLARAFVTGDPHFGYFVDRRTNKLTPLHNEDVLDITLALVQASKPDLVLVLGDILDLADWSDKYFRSPEFSSHTQRAIIDAHRWAVALRESAPCAEIIWLMGNHGERMRRAIVNRLLAAHELRAADELELPPAMSLPRLLALHKLDIRWIDEYPGGEVWLNSGLRASHGEVASNVPGGTAGKVVQKSDVTEIYGHTHKLEFVARTRITRTGRRVTAAFSPGCTCWTDGRVPANTKNVRWQNGCGIVDYEIDGSGFNIMPVLIEHGKAIWNGRLYTRKVNDA